MPITEKRCTMAINLSSTGGSPISADLLYQFYDNKAITPQIRAALQKKEDEVFKEDGAGGSSSSSASKAGPATRVSISDQLIRMNVANNSAKYGKAEEKVPETSGTAKKPSRYDVLAEVKKNVAEREAKAKEEKDAKLKEITDKIAAEEAAKKAAEGTAEAS
jgi:hypothetical protein